MIFKRNASDFMTTNVIMASEGSTFDQVMTFFTEHKIQHLPVGEGNKLIGIISIKDMLSYIANQLKANQAATALDLGNNFSITAVMTVNPITVSPDSPQQEVLEKLSTGRFQALPVVKEGYIQGIITNKDITRLYNYDLNH